MFTIKIEETRPIRRIIGKRWQKVGQKEKPCEHAEGVYLSDVMGYTPEVETVVDETRTVLMQEVDELNMPAVITAINGLSE